MKLALKYILVFFLAALCVGASWVGYLIYEKPYDFRQITLNPASEGQVHPQDTTLSGAIAKAMGQALRNAQPVPSLPEYATKQMTVLTHTEGTALAVYELYIGSILNREGYFYSPQKQTYFRLSTADFVLLLSDPAFADAYPERQPTQTASLLWGDTEVRGVITGLDYRYLLANGSYKHIEHSDQNIPEPFPVQGSDLKLQFSARPEALNVAILRNGVLFRNQNGISPKELYVPEETGIYLYQITASYPLSLEQDWYGEITWTFRVELTDAPAA